MSNVNLTKAAEVLAAADAVLIGAGAGMGVDSGLPDFRGDEGFWRAYPPFKERGLGFQSMANPRWFDNDPELAWGFYGHRLNLYRDTRPHSGFEILLRHVRQTQAGYFIFTSNVDGQFQAAGFAPDRIVECHGSIHHLQCVTPCSQTIWPAGAVEPVVDPDTFRATPPLPSCTKCNTLARPNILMFGDRQFIGDRSYAQEQQMRQWLQTLGGQKLAVVECGAGTAVPTVRWQCEKITSELDATLIRINPREAHGPPGTISLAMGAQEALERINELLQ